MTDLDALLSPPTPVAALSLEVAREWTSPALVNHCLRSWAWAVLLARVEDVPYDAELLFVAAMLHDTGVAPHFDAHEIPFEEAGGALAWSFAAGAGWPVERRARARQVIERHMWRSVDVSLDPEGHLLEVATTLDVRGDGAPRWREQDLRDVTARLPRLDFGDSFAASIEVQALRKPTSHAARLHGAAGPAAGTAFWTPFLAS